MTTYVLTAIGDDRPGLVSALSSVVDDHGGSWVDSSLALLAGKFAGIVLVDVAESRAERFVQELATLAEQVGLRLEATAAAAASAAPPGSGPSLRLHLLWRDLTATTREVTPALAPMHATTGELRPCCREAREGGGRRDDAEARLRLAEGGDAYVLRAALQTIAAELRLFFELDDPTES